MLPVTITLLAQYWPTAAFVMVKNHTTFLEFAMSYLTQGKLTNRLEQITPTNEQDFVDRKQLDCLRPYDAGRKRTPGQAEAKR